MRLPSSIALLALLSSCAVTTEMSQILAPIQVDSKPMTLSIDYAMLASHVLKNTPEYTHFAPGTVFTWCYLASPGGIDPVPELTERVLAKLQEIYVVYLDEAEIPDENKIFVEDKFYAYTEGFRFTFRVELLDPKTVRIHYEDWEAPLAGSTHFKVYEWIGDFWNLIEEGPMAVS